MLCKYSVGYESKKVLYMMILLVSGSLAFTLIYQFRKGVKGKKRSCFTGVHYEKILI